MSPLIEINERGPQQTPSSLYMFAPEDDPISVILPATSKATFVDLDKDLALLPEDASKGGRTLCPVKIFQKIGTLGITPEKPYCGL